MRDSRRTSLLILEVIMILAALVWIYPFVIVILNSLKGYKDMMTRFFGLPFPPVLENYRNAWNELNFSRVVFNTFVLTAGGCVGIIAVSSLAAYKLSRTTTRLSWLLLMVCIAPMMVPFQTIMISLTQVARRLHLSGSLEGLIVQYWGFGAPFAIFLYHGFIKTVPRELDEHARIDGASTLRLFTSIVFPLLKPVTITIVVIDAMWIWNDFLLPLLMISSNKKLVNIQVVLYQNIGYYYAKWEYALPVVVMSIIPALLIFVALQKYIVEGVTTGAIKG